MRRAVAVIIGGGLLLGGALPMAGRAQAASAGTVTPAGTRTVTYDGYQVDVPRNWPVYRLDGDAHQCVRYDVHAVYLGLPGGNQQCPAGLIGRTETVSILPRAPGGAGWTAGQDPGSHELQVTPSGSPDVMVTATYGSDRALIGKVLGTLRTARAGTAPAGTAPAGTELAAPAAAGTAPAAPAAAGTAPEAPRQPVTGTSWHGLPAPWPTEIVQTAPPPPPPAPVPVQPKPGTPLLGFDTCATPSLATMRAWRPYYAAIAMYIGGVNAACYDGNVTASWVASAAGMGWSMLPTYVGPQAPCYGYGTMLKQAQAAEQGTAAAQDAAWNAQRLGLPKRSPIYYDMEAYHSKNASKNASCRTAVLAFLSAWTREINVKGFMSGVYASMNSGISDMQAAQSAKNPGFTPPQAIWYAKWDRHRELNDGTLSWPQAARAKQFIGPHNITIGGITLNIDTDLVGGPALGRRPPAH